MDQQTEEATIKYLIEQNVLPAQKVEDLRQIVTEGKSMREALVEGKVIDDETFAQAQAAVLQLPYVNLSEQNIPREVLAIIPEQTAREHAIIAYDQTETELKVAMADPSDRQIIEFIRKKVDQEVVVAVASTNAVRTALAKYQESLDIELKKILQEVGNVSVENSDDLSKVAEDLPTIRVTDLILKHAILQNASDIHIEPTEKNVIIRFRIDGILHDVLLLPKNFLTGLVARLKVLSNLKIDEHRLPQDGRFKIETDDYKVAFRVSILPVFNGEKVVMRLLDESGRGLDLNSIGMRARQLEIFRRNISKPHGMILVTGPTGSGKTTTLYAAMRELNTPEVNINTIEDPIEYRMPRINQTQVNSQIGLTFSSGLRSLVRQDPDILMVGEIRDEETAALAVNAALTGHLVLSTLHTNSASGALPRLIDMQVEAFLISSTINALAAQRLLRRLCEDCRQETTISKEILSEISKVISLEQLSATLQQEGVLEGSLETVKIYEPGSCRQCTAGYRGRVGIYEVLEFTDEIREIIKPTTTSQQLQEAARKQQQMVTMIEDGFIKVIEGTTSIAEVIRVAKE